MNSPTPFRVLSGLTGSAFMLLGLALVASFFGYQDQGSAPSFSTGPVGHYFIAFSGCALLGWGGALLGAARNPLANRAIAASTALALVLMSVVRMLAWTVGDYYVSMGELPRAEAGVFLLLALAFLWLRPEAVSMPTPTQSQTMPQGEN